MSDNSIVNLDNLALSLMQAGVQKIKDEGLSVQYGMAVKSIALKIKDNQALTKEQQESVLNLLYRGKSQHNKGAMRRILSEIGSQLEYKQHAILPQNKL